MKKFTKGALITALVFVMLGFTLCAVGAGIGFRYTSIPQMIHEGVFQLGFEPGRWNNRGSWSRENTQEFDFSAEEIQNLDIDVDCGAVTVEQASDGQKIQVEVQYRKANTKREVQVEKAADTLRIIENKGTSIINNDDVHVTVRVPKGKEFAGIDLQNNVGSITIKCAMTTDTCNIIVDTGECDVQGTLKVLETLYAEVGVGEIDFGIVEAGKIELNADVGQIDVEQVTANEVILKCDVGEIDMAMNGAEEDFDYTMNCGIGKINLGAGRYSGINHEKEVHHGKGRHMDISCDIGSVNIDFTR